MLFLLFTTAAPAQDPDQADQLYQAFKQRYAEAETVEDLQEALALVQSAHNLMTTDYRYAFGIGATYERLTNFTNCLLWFEKAVELAASDEHRNLAQIHQEYCQNELDKIAVLERSPTIRISFATKLAFARREMDASALPKAFPNVLDTDQTVLVRGVQDRLPPHMSVVAHEHAVIAAPGRKEDAVSEGDRIAEFEAQIRRRFFPELPKKRIIFLLGEEPFELRRIVESLYPGVVVPHAPFFGFYHKSDRLIVATALGGYGTVLHELMHALVADDFPDAPLWLEEGMATLYERSAWSSERLIPVANWRMDLIGVDQTLGNDVFTGIGNDGEVSPETLSIVRLLFTYLDNEGELKTLYKTVKERGPDTTLSEALAVVEFDRSGWQKFAEQSLREYAIEMSTVSGGGLSNPGEIKFVQRALNTIGDAGLKPDGLWGSKTAQALRDFQQRFGLEVDGVVGHNTMITLRREYGKRSLE